MFLLLIETSLATCKFKFIHNASELIEFSNEVNDGTTYSDYTVYLVSDIDFNETLSQKYVPIGKDVSKYFLGTFDGQGYVIRNLTASVPSTTIYGTFGFSFGITIKNVVVDESCSFSSSFTSTSSNVFAGGIIGWCSSNDRSCIIENSVNMAEIDNSGNAGNFIYAGGIVGGISISTVTYETRIINCVNYGTVRNSGDAFNALIIGGIVGGIYASVANYKDYLYNCLNYGTVKNTGKSSNYYYIGGIVGSSYGATLSNCMSTGKVSSSKSSAGGILSQSWEYTTTLSHCYWTSNTSCTYYYETYRNFNVLGVHKIKINSTYANELNTYAINNKWNEWTYNQNTAEIKFVVFNGKGFSLSSQLIILPEAARRGYSFLFWCANQNSTEGCVNRYDHTKTSGYTAETTLYAQWVVNNCTVNFDVNRGNALPENKRSLTNVYDQKIGKLPVTTRRGYTFTGWYNVLNERFTSNSLVNNACNCSLYAHWTPNKYNVTFDVNRGVELENKTKEVTFDEIYGELPSPNRSGFVFAGWITKDNEIITNVTIVNITSNQTLYANWTANEYTVTLNVNGGNELTGYDGGIKVPADKACDLLPTPNKRGYTFAGWYTEDGKLITSDTATTAIVTKNQIISAKWIPNNYTVSFNVTDGDELPDDKKNVTVTYDGTYDSLPEPTRTGYTFSGWFTGDGEAITNETRVKIVTNQTIHAEWTANKYNVSFNANGGELTEHEGGITVTFDSNYSGLPTPTKEGYTFLWWYIESTKEKVDNNTKIGTACNHTLCAAWNKNTILFDVNGGDILPDGKKEMDVTYGDSYGSLPTPNKIGYTFAGWFTEDGEEITNEVKVEIVTNQILHAEWTANNYTISFDVNGGDELPEDKKNTTVTYDEAYGSLPTPNKTGYTFSGWFTEGREEIKAGSEITISYDQTLRANWTANNYTISFDVNGGNELSGDEKEMKVVYDDVYGSLPTPTKKGYTFDGWFTEGGEEITNESKVEIPANQILYAHWTEIILSEVPAPSKYVEIVFEKEGMSEEEIRDILKKFTTAEFDITDIENSKSGETTVIIRFKDVSDAEMFLAALSESDGNARHFIRSASFKSGADGSISAVVYPFMLVGALLI